MSPQLDAKFQTVPVGELRFDPNNPRLGGVAKHKDQTQIQEYLEGPPNYALELVGSIVENGFLPYEPLIVRRAAGKFVVIEGNRRLAAVQAILAEPEKYTAEVCDGLKEIPVLVFAEGGRDSEEVLKYLGVKHLFGFRDWPPTSKAMFLDERIKTKKDLGQVLKELNIKRGEAGRYLIPYRLKKVAKKAFKGVETEDFWSLAESFGRKNIRSYVQLDVDRRAMRIRGFDATKMRYLARFLYGKRRRVTDTRQLSSLSKVLGSTDAAKKLEQGATLEEAMLYVEPKRETLAHLHRQLEKIFDKIKTLSPGKEDSAKILDLIEEFGKKLKK
jgi:ParB-like nuclease domain